ncbi:hypothetical protein TNCV_4267051 [Trichonephila clavipes]|nr:hypothetical protein TNCV_4267051 [Trichonephila clavipes]
MKSAFNQIPLHFADRHKTAFSTPDGDKYQFNRLCFGLKNSPKAFQSIAQEVLGDLLHHGALVYIDDIILFTKTIDEHFELLGRKFKVFTDHKPLAGFLSNKNPSSKILRWKLALEEFNYDIHYIMGSLNSVADHLSRYINNITIALPDSKDLINMQREDSVLSTIIQKIDQNDVSPQISNYFINGEGLLCHLSKRPSRSPRSNTTRKQHGRDIRLSYTYEKNSDTPQNKYEYVEKLLPSLEHTFNKVLKNLKDQEASHVELSTRATKQHHYDYKIGSLCFIKTPNIKSNLSPKLRPKFEGPYRVIERFSNVNYRVQHVEQLRKRFNTHVNRMIPFVKRFSYLHLKNLDDLQPDETEVKGIVPSPRYNLRARAAEHDIELESERAIVSKPYRMFPRQIEILKSEVNKMLEQKIIEPGETDFTSPLIFVEAPGKEARPCIDQGRLNKATRTQFIPLPNIEELLEMILAAKNISLSWISLEGISPRAQGYAMLVTTFANFKPLKLPFGLKNAPYYFSRLMVNLLRNCEDYAVPYLDDIAIFSLVWDDHVKHLEDVFDCLCSAKLHIKPSKCQFAQAYVKYFGHLVDQGLRNTWRIKGSGRQRIPDPH